MIQRIQTIYLILATLFFSLMFSGTLVNFSNTDSEYFLTWSGINSMIDNSKAAVQNTEILMILLFLLPVLSFTAIFLFKNRRAQMIFTLLITGTAILALLMGTYYSLKFQQKYEVDINLNFRLLFPLISILFLLLAHRGIRKDESLVKSYDRLR